MPRKTGKPARTKRKLLKQKITASTAKTAGNKEQAVPPKKLASAWQLTKSVSEMLWRHRSLFIGITLTYGLLNLLLVRGLAGGTDVNSLKHGFSQAFGGHFGPLLSSAGVFVVLVSSAGNSSSQTAGAYQLFLALITSMAVIYALRQLMAGSSVHVRDTYYKGMYPLIPFVLVLLVIGLQLIPLLAGSSIYSIITANGIAVGAAEKLLFIAVFVLLGGVSLYFLNSSIFALYIVTLPDMTPLKALRSARQLVRGRRWVILRKQLYLPVALLAAAAIIMLPIILLLTPLAQWVFFILTMFALVAVHAYFYALYRELLDE